MRRCLRGKIISLSLVGLGGFLMGTSLGLALGSRSETNFEEDRWWNAPENLSNADKDGDYIDREMLQSHYKRMSEIYSDASPQTKELLEEEYSYEDIENDDEFEIIEHKKMTFVDGDGEEVEMINTSEGFIPVATPYIISEDEFLDPSVFSEFDRNTLIYYEDDDVLATDRDEVIQNVDEMIGTDALTNFGYMSGSKDVVFVRNVKLGSNFEIIRESGSYQELVLGLPEEDVDYEKAKKFFKEMDDGKV